MWNQSVIKVLVVKMTLWGIYKNLGGLYAFLWLWVHENTHLAACIYKKIHKINSFSINTVFNGSLQEPEKIELLIRDNWMWEGLGVVFRGHILKMWVDAGRRKEACENEN